MSYPELGPPVQITQNGGTSPHWNGRGNELFYQGAGGDISVVPVSTQGGVLRPGAAKALFPTQGTPGFGFGVAPDGQHFVITSPNPNGLAREIRVVLNFFEELKAKVGN